MSLSKHDLRKLIWLYTGSSALSLSFLWHWIRWRKFHQVTAQWFHWLRQKQLLQL